MRPIHTPNVPRIRVAGGAPVVRGRPGYGSGVTDDTAIPVALRALLASDTRIALVLATLLIGAGTAFALAFLLPPESRTYAGVAPLTQLVLSIAAPFSTALLTYDLRDPDGDFRSRTVAPLRSRWVASGIFALAVGAYGAVVVGVAVAVAASPSSADPWAAAAPAVVGSVVVQLIPAGVGCAAGLLVPRGGLACLATVVVPVGFTLLVGVLAPRGTADWITPLGAAGHLVPGPMSILHWAQWIVTAALWVVVPNWIGRRLLAAHAELASR